MGGSAGHGLRRMLLSSTGERIQVLEHGEFKHVSNQRVILVPGPPSEVAAVRRIYSMALWGMSHVAIAQELNRLNVPYQNGHPWSYWMVERRFRSTSCCTFSTSIWARGLSEKRHQARRLLSSEVLNRADFAGPGSLWVISTNGPADWHPR